jgi:hypothetical protein
MGGGSLLKGKLKTVGSVACSSIHCTTRDNSQKSPSCDEWKNDMLYIRL